MPHVSPESPDTAAAAALHEMFAVLLQRQESFYHGVDLGGVLYTPCQITVISTLKVVNDGIAKAALYTDSSRYVCCSSSLLCCLLPALTVLQGLLRATMSISLALHGV